MHERARPRVCDAIEWCRELDRKGIRAMVALLAIAGPVVLALLFWWMSRATDRRTERSMARYGSALDVLGDVSRRTEVGAPVRIPSADEIAQPHIDFDPDLSLDTERDDRPLLPEDARVAESPARSEPLVVEKPALEKFQGMPLFDDLPSVPNAREATESGMDPNATAAALGRMVARSRFNREYGVPAGDRLTTGTEARVHLPAPTVPLRFGSDDVEALDDVTTAVPAVDLAQPGGHRGLRRRDLRVGPRSGSKQRRQLLGAGAVAVLVIVGVLVFTLDHSPAPVATKPGATSPGGTQPGGAQKTTTTATPAPKVLDPIATTNLLVTYVVPKPTYTLVFSATGACWLGAQRRTKGTYLWMDTLEAGKQTSYTASGPRLIRIGAPRAISSITLDGIPVVLPSGHVQSYVIKLEVPKKK
jgi:hypothetical protein